MNFSPGEVGFWALFAVFVIAGVSGGILFIRDTRMHYQFVCTQCRATFRTRNPQILTQATREHMASHFKQALNDPKQYTIIEKENDMSDSPVNPDLARENVAFEYTSKNPTKQEMLGEAMGAVSMCWFPTPTGTFNSEFAKKIYDRIAKDLEIDGPNIAEATHDANTLYTVTDALVDSGLNANQARDAINAMQNAGILFREVNRG